MSLTPDKERAVNYETLYTLTSDRERAYKLTMALPDPEAPFGDAVSVISELLEKRKEEVVSLREEIALSFENERIATKAIFPESPLFPHEYGEYFPVIYASGNLELLKTRTLTILGMLRPSMQGRYDALQVLSYLISEDVTAILTLDDGIPFLVAENMLSRNGNVIAILSDPISRCSSANEAKLRARIYASGLLLSVFPPSVRSERWHVVVRNNFIASISESVFLAEEKDGGPSWAVFDKVLARGGRAMLSSSMLEVPSYTWAGRHIESGSLTYSSEKDLRRLLPKKVKASREPDLFS